jgi:hypothetical protein
MLRGFGVKVLWGLLAFAPLGGAWAGAPAAAHGIAVEATPNGWAWGDEALPWRVAPGERGSRTGGAPVDTCFGAVLAGRVTGEHVAVDYEDGVDPALAAALLADVEAAWAEEIGARGWPAPTGSDAYLAAVQLYPRALGAAATALRDCGASRVPVTVFGLDTVQDPVQRAGVAAHELHHMSQLALYADDAGPEVWFWEASAVWMQRQVLGEASWRPYLDAYAATPWIGLFDDRRAIPEVLGHMYGRAVWVGWLAAQHGDGVVRSLWDAGLGLPARGYDLDQRALLGGVGLDVEFEHAAFVDATARGALGVGEVPDLQVAIGLSGASSASVPAPVAPADWGLLTVSLGPYDVAMDVAWAPDPGAPWVVSWQTASVEVAPGALTATLPAGEVGRVLLSPRPPDVVDGRTWSVSWTVSPAAAADPVDTGAPRDTDTGGGGDDPPGRCGCGVAPDAGLGVVGWVGVWAAARRRRASRVDPWRGRPPIG